MTIDKAIKVLDTFATTRAAPSVETLREAVKLGIEALKREIKHRHVAKSNYIWLLPGETKE